MWRRVRNGEMQEQTWGSRSFIENGEMAKCKSRSGVTMREAGCGHCPFVREQALWAGGTEARRTHSAIRVIDVSTTMGAGVAALTQAAWFKGNKRNPTPRVL